MTADEALIVALACERTATVTARPSSIAAQLKIAAITIRLMEPTYREAKQLEQYGDAAKAALQIAVDKWQKEFSNTLITKE